MSRSSSVFFTCTQGGCGQLNSVSPKRKGDNVTCCGCKRKVKVPVDASSTPPPRPMPSVVMPLGARTHQPGVAAALKQLNVAAAVAATTGSPPVAVSA